MLAYSVSGFAQFGGGKVAIVDVEYILKNMPMYESANEQVKQITKKWQTEVEQKHEEARMLQKNYQTEVVFLSDEMKKAKEELFGDAGRRQHFRRRQRAVYCRCEIYR